MSAESPKHNAWSEETALWRAVIDQALQDAIAIKRIMRDGRPTFAGQEIEKARSWFWRADANFAFVCDCADLDDSAVASYAQAVIHGGGWRQRRYARRTVGRGGLAGSCAAL